MPILHNKTLLAILINNPFYAAHIIIAHDYLLWHLNMIVAVILDVVDVVDCGDSTLPHHLRTEVISRRTQTRTRRQSARVRRPAREFTSNVEGVALDAVAGRIFCGGGLLVAVTAAHDV